MIRGLHYHERGQDDLFACLQGTARVVVLDRETGETFTEDIGDENPVAIYIPGIHAHGFEALTDLPLLLPRDRGVRPLGSRRARDRVERPARRAPVEHAVADPLAAGPRRRVDQHGVMVDARGRGAGGKRRVVITGAGGQLGRALTETFAGDELVALSHEDWDVALPPPPLEAPDLVLHAGRVDERRRRRGRSAGRGGRQRRRDAERGVARGAARLLLDRLRLRRDEAHAVRRVRRAEPALRVRPDEAARRGGGRRARVDRALVVALRPDRAQLRAHDAAPRRRARRGRRRGRPARLADVRRAPRRGDALDRRAARSASTTSRRRATARGPTSRRRSSRRPGSRRACAGSPPQELGRPAPRPAYSVLRSEKPETPRSAELAGRAPRVPGANWLTTASSPPGSSTRRSTRVWDVVYAIERWPNVVAGRAERDRAAPRGRRRRGHDLPPRLALEDPVRGALRRHGRRGADGRT